MNCIMSAIVLGFLVLTITVIVTGNKGANTTVLKSAVPTVPSAKKCPDGYVRYASSCYKFYRQQFSWIEALAYCRSFERSLLTLETRDEYSFVKAHLHEIVGGYPGAGFWTSATAAERTGHWIWAEGLQDVDFNGTLATTTPSSDTEDCLMMRKNSGYNVSVEACKTLLHFICEIKVSK